MHQTKVKVHTNKEGKVVLVNGDTDAKKVQPTNKVAISKEVPQIKLSKQ